MPHVQIDDQDPFVNYTVGATAQSAFAIPFAFIDEDTDVKITVDGELVDADDYTVVGTTGYSRGFPGGTLTLDTAVSNCSVTVYRDTAIARTSDHPVSGPLDINTLNTDLDKSRLIEQEQRHAIERSLRFPIGTVATEMGAAADWQSKLLGFGADGVTPTPYDSVLTSATLTGVEFSTKLAFDAGTIDDAQQYVTLIGYYTAGDMLGMRAVFKRVASQPDHDAYLEKDGDYFELMNRGYACNIRMTGVQGSGANDTDKTQAFIDIGGGVVDAMYSTTGVVATSDFMLVPASGELCGFKAINDPGTGLVVDNWFSAPGCNVRVEQGITFDGNADNVTVSGTPDLVDIAECTGYFYGTVIDAKGNPFVLNDSDDFVAKFTTRDAFCNAGWNNCQRLVWHVDCHGTDNRGLAMFQHAIDGGDSRGCDIFVRIFDQGGDAIGSSSGLTGLTLINIWDSTIRWAYGRPDAEIYSLAISIVGGENLRMVNDYIFGARFGVEFIARDSSLTGGTIDGQYIETADGVGAASIDGIIYHGGGFVRPPGETTGLLTHGMGGRLRSRISGINIMGCGTGIRLRGGGLDIHDCFIRGSVVDGIRFQVFTHSFMAGGTGEIFDKINIYNNVITANARAGILIESARETRIHDNLISNNGQNDMDSSTTAAQRSAIFFSTSANTQTAIEIVDNTLNDNQGYGTLAEKLTYVPGTADSSNLYRVRVIEHGRIEYGQFITLENVLSGSADVTGKIVEYGVDDDHDELVIKLPVTLAYDGQTANFTVGSTLTGGSSGATAIIIADNDSGTTGTLTLWMVTTLKTFTDNEAITDAAGGAAVANGAVVRTTLEEVLVDPGSTWTYSLVGTEHRLTPAGTVAASQFKGRYNIKTGTGEYIQVVDVVETGSNISYLELAEAPAVALSGATIYKVTCGVTGSPSQQWALSHSASTTDLLYRGNHWEGNVLGDITGTNNVPSQATLFREGSVFDIVVSGNMTVAAASLISSTFIPAAGYRGLGMAVIWTSDMDNGVNTCGVGHYDGTTFTSLIPGLTTAKNQKGAAAIPTSLTFAGMTMRGEWSAGTPDGTYRAKIRLEKLVPANFADVS